MQHLEKLLTGHIIEGVKKLYNTSITFKDVQLQKTRKNFTGDLTVVVFPFLRFSKKTPEATGLELGKYLHTVIPDVCGFNTVKGFLNLEVSEAYYLHFLQENMLNSNYGKTPAGSVSGTTMVEYSSPNTNKPLHLGHIRNNLLGHSVCEILAATGKNIIKTNIVNDRGIHICKSMLAWQLWGNGETPESSGLKGDHLVGKYYVMFDQEYKKEVAQLINNGIDADEAKKTAPLLLQAQDMLRKWEAKDPDVLSLWEKMNNWVYKGFDQTYNRMGVSFDKIYYESDTYHVGKETVLKGLEKGLFYRRNDNSVWADLTSNGLDEKLLLRKDGTSVYMTQDIGTAQMRQRDFSFSNLIYVVGNEQDYHFKVLAILLDKLGFEWAKNLHHLSYGMVELPEGKMKSREGTVVDADDLMDEMIDTARKMSDELGKLDGFTHEDKEAIFRKIGLGALKYFILKVDPKKNMTFNPKESIDFNGNTGPFIQYTNTRVKSVFRKASQQSIAYNTSLNTQTPISDKEKSIIKLIYDYPQVLNEAAENCSPAIICNYIYELAKEYNQFYHDHKILTESDSDKRDIRFGISAMVSNVIESGMQLLGIEMPDRM